MSINLNLTCHAPLECMPILSSAYVARFANHTFLSLQKATSYFQRHHSVAAASLVAVNLILINLLDKLIDIASNRFKLGNEEWVSDTPLKRAGILLFKGVMLGLGVNGCNKFMNMGLSQLHLAATVIVALASQMIWQIAMRSSLNGSPQVVVSSEDKRPAVNQLPDAVHGSPPLQAIKEPVSLKDQGKTPSFNKGKEGCSPSQGREEFGHDIDPEGFPSIDQDGKALPEESILSSQVLEKALEGAEQYRQPI